MSIILLVVAILSGLGATVLKDMSIRIYKEIFNEGNTNTAQAMKQAPTSQYKAPSVYSEPKEARCAYIYRTENKTL